MKRSHLKIDVVLDQNLSLVFHFGQATSDWCQQLHLRIDSEKNTLGDQLWDEINCFQQGS